MSPRLRSIGFNSPQQQQGAIGLMAAVTLGVVLLFMLLVIDSGRLYLEQRKLQRVADMAVLEAVSRGGSCTSGTAVTYVNESVTRNGFTPGAVQKITPTCGTLVTINNLRTFQASTTQSSAIRVIATTTVPTSVAGGLWSLFSPGGFQSKTNLTASAVGATQGPTLAQLSIRSTLLKVDSKNSPLLNTLFSGLLGTSLQVDALGWDGLLNANINILQYLNELSVVALNLKVGDYTQLLKTNVTAAQLIQAAANVAKVNNATADVQLALKNLADAALKVPAIKEISAGDLFNLKTGTTSAGLDANIQLFQLVQAIIQIANKNNAIAATLPIDLLGLAKITTKVQVIEPPQFSSIGDPKLALNTKPEDANAIYVRTAQVRTLTSIEVPLTNLVDSFTNLLNGVLCLLGCDLPNIKTINPLIININLDAGGAQALLTAYSCSTDAKSLTVDAESAIAELRVGQIADPATVFTVDTVKMNPLPLINILAKCKGSECPPKDFSDGGIALTLDTPIAKTTHSNLTFIGDSAPTNLKLPPAELHMKPTGDIVKSLNATLAGISIKIYGPANSNGVLDTLASTVSTALTNILTAVLQIILPAIITALGSILDPLINQLLSLLGINLMDTVIGANLSCGQGGRAQLVL